MKYVKVFKFWAIFQYKMEREKENPKEYWNRNSHLLKPKVGTKKPKVFVRNKEKCDKLLCNINPPTGKTSKNYHTYEENT